MLDSSEEAKAHAAALDDFYDNLTVVNAVDENERGAFNLLVRQMMDAMGKYYTVHEIVWKPGVEARDGESGTRDILTAELRFAPLWFFENRTGRLRFLPVIGAAEGEPLEPGGWMITKGDGLMEACCVAWMFKHLPLKDWLTYSEKFGMPQVIGRTQAGPESEAGQGMQRAVEAFGNNFAAVIFGDDGSGKIETIDVSKSSAALPFPELIRRMDSAMCALWRGSDLSTLSSKDAAGASLQHGESAILLEDDAQLISDTLNIYIDREVIWQRFGTRQPLAYSQLVVPQSVKPIDLQVDDFLIRHGVQLGKRERAEYYGRPSMDEDDEPMEAAAAPVAEGGEPGAPGQPGAGTPGQRGERDDRRPQCRGDAGDLANTEPDTVPDRRELEADDAAMRGRFLDRAMAALADASRADLAPITQRINALLALPDDQFQAGLQKLREDAPKLAASILQDPQAAAAFAEALGASLVNGLSQGPAHAAQGLTAFRHAMQSRSWPIYSKPKNPTP